MKKNKDDQIHLKNKRCIQEDIKLFIYSEICERKNNDFEKKRKIKERRGKKERKKEREGKIKTIERKRLTESSKKRAKNDKQLFVMMLRM